MRFVHSSLAILAGVAVGLCAVTTRADDFSVSSLPGLQWWASATQSQLAQNPDGTGAVANPGDPVGFISDLSGNGHNAVMGNAILAGGDADRPTFQNNLASGGVGIYFNGADFLSLQDSLFNGASAATIAIAIGMPSTAPNNQTIFGASSAGLGISTLSSSMAYATLNNGQQPSLFASGAINTYADMGSDKMTVLIARLEANGESDLWQNGVLVGSWRAPPSATAARSIVSPSVKLLGNLNVATAARAISPSATQGISQYFLEGLATNTALSDSQVSNVYNYLTQQWPGVQEVSQSPNLYWNAAINTQRKVATTVNGGHIEGVTAGDNLHYIFHTAIVEEYDSNWNLITNNQSMGSGIYPAGSSLHCGGGAYAQGKIFAPLEQDFDGGGKGIAVYDATKPGLPLITFKPLSATHHEFSALAIAPLLGQSGVMAATSYFATPGGAQLWLYDYANGNVNAPNFGNFLGSIPIPSAVTGIQGVAWKAPYFYFSSAPDMGIDRVLYQNGTLASTAQLIWKCPTTVQGDGFDGADLLEALQSGSATDLVYTAAGSKFSTTMGVGVGSWNSNSSGVYNSLNSNTGFDGVIPNGVGATAILGGGTINTITAPTIHVTVNGAYTVGSLQFAPSGTTNYVLDSDQQAGHGLTLNSGAAGGSTVSVTAGNHAIGASVTIADPVGATVNVAQGASLEFDGPLSLNQAATLHITGGGKVRLNGAVSPQSMAPGASLLIDAGSTLELAGVAPALVPADGSAGPASIVNNSTGVDGDDGLLVTGQNQVAGAVSGSGSLLIQAGSDLTVSQITQSSITIGGTDGNPALLTIAASGSAAQSATSFDSAASTSTSAGLARILATRRKGVFSSGVIASGSGHAASQFDLLLASQNTSGATLVTPEPAGYALAALGSIGLATGFRVRAASGSGVRLKLSRRQSAQPEENAASVGEQCEEANVSSLPSPRPLR